MMVSAEMGDDMPMQHKVISKAVEGAQRKVENINFSMRKNVLEYDDVMNKQRQVIYAERNKILDGKDLSEHVDEVMSDTVRRCVAEFCPADARGAEADLEGLHKWLVELTGHLDAPEFEAKDAEALTGEVLAYVDGIYDEKAERLGEELMRDLNTQVMLRVIDTRWMNYLQEMDYPSRVSACAVSVERDPLVEYKTEAFGAFLCILVGHHQYEDYLRTVLRVELRQAPAPVSRRPRPARRDVFRSRAGRRRFRLLHAAPAKAKRASAANAAARARCACGRRCAHLPQG